MEENKLAAFGQRVAARMEALWKLDVFDPPKGSSHPRAKFCLKTIEDIIKRNGWSWATPYLGDGPPQWCGMTAGDAYAEAGLDTSWLRDYFASTHRLYCFAKYQRFSRTSKPNPKPDATVTDRRLYVDLRKPFTVKPLPGDIVIVGDGDPDVGDHVTVNMGYNPTTKTFDTISGNGGGLSPKGVKNNGISRKNYRVGQAGYAPMFLIRLASSDLP